MDIVDLVGSYLTLRRSGAYFQGLCPFHQEKTPSFTVSPARQIFKCYGCGAGGDVFSFVQLKENVGFAEAFRILADRAGISVEAVRGSQKSGPGKQDLARLNRWAQEFFRQNFAAPAGQAARKYASRRGLTGESIEAFGIGFALDGFDGLLNRAQSAGIALPLLEAAGLLKTRERGGFYDTFRNRLMFPIVDATDRIIAFGGRTLGEDPAKYLNSPATALFDKSTSLFGLNLARQAMSTASRAIVMEGYTDCMMAHQFGFSETVATLGTAMTESHAHVLRRYTDRLVLLFDSDEAGQRAADRAISVTLSSGLDVLLARVPEGKDPCDYLLLAGRGGLENVLKQAIGALEFKWNLVAREYEASATSPGRRRALEAYLQQVSAWLRRGVIDPIQKGLLVNQLSKVLALPAEDVHRQLERITRRSAVRFSGDQGASEGSGEGGTGAPGAEQRAFQQVMEVLLNEPAWLAKVDPYFEPTAIRDRRMAALAVELVSMLRSGEPFELSELIGRFESPEYGRMITDLQARGERRGSYGAVIEGAIPCLRSCQQARRTAALAEEIRRSRQESGDRQEGAAAAENSGESVPDGEDQRLLALAELARNPGFSTLRARKRFL